MTVGRERQQCTSSSFRDWVLLGGNFPAYLCAVEFRRPCPLRGPAKEYRLCVPLHVFQPRRRGDDHPRICLVRKQLVRLRDKGHCRGEGYRTGHGEKRGVLPRLGDMECWLGSGQNPQVRPGIHKVSIRLSSHPQAPCFALTGYHRVEKSMATDLTFTWRSRSDHGSSHLTRRPDVAAVRAEINGDDGAVVRRQHGCKNVFLVRAATKPPIIDFSREYARLDGWAEARREGGWNYIPEENAWGFCGSRDLT